MHNEREMLASPSGERVSLRHTCDWAFEQGRHISYIGMKYRALLNWIEFIDLYYTTGNLSDIDHTANNEANGPFK